MAVDPLSEIYAGMSAYNYVGNNPINSIDPNGMSISGVNQPSGSMPDGFSFRDSGIDYYYGTSAQQAFRQDYYNQGAPPNEYVYNSKTGEYTQVSNEGGDDYDIITVNNGLSTVDIDYEEYTYVVLNIEKTPRYKPGMFLPKPATGLASVTESPIDYLIDLPVTVLAKAGWGITKAGLGLIFAFDNLAYSNLAKNSSRVAHLQGNLYKVKSGAWVNPSGKISYKNGFVSGDAVQLKELSKYDMIAWKGSAKPLVQPNMNPRSKWKLIIDGIFGHFDDTRF